MGYVISAPGIYCLATDVIMGSSFTSGAAITIAANYVTLDLNGHKIHGGAAPVYSNTSGIYASNRRGVTVRNGTVWGFWNGLFLDANPTSFPTAYVVDGIRAESNRYYAMFVRGAGSVVRNNLILNTLCPVGWSEAAGLSFASDGGRVLSNDVVTVTCAGETTPGGSASPSRPTYSSRAIGSQAFPRGSGSVSVSPVSFVTT